MIVASWIFVIVAFIGIKRISWNNEMLALQLMIVLMVVWVAFSVIMAMKCYTFCEG